MEEPPPHRRRPRYRGTHPRRFDEKYKELDPARFPDAAEKAIERGSTPAGAHLPVLLDEVLAALAPHEGDVVVDATLGFGGHAEAIAARIGGAGRIVGIDRDADELARATARLAALGVVIHAHHGSFSGAAKALRDAGHDAADSDVGDIGLADIVLADLGCSSMQLDRAKRGFSFKTDGPLDMRMDRSRAGTAAEWLASAAPDEIRSALADFGEEPDAAAVAAEIVRRRGAGQPLATTSDLVAAVLAAKRIPGTRFRRADAFEAHPAARTFQAVRCVVNREMEHLAQFLRDLPWTLRADGRAAVITFHSGEARRVRAAFEDGAAQGLWRTPLAEPVAPGAAERRRNPRSRSARLHAAVRA